MPTLSMVHRVTRIFSMMVVLLGAVNLRGAERRAEKDRPNILFLAVDDMNDWIGCLESVPQAITPNLNRLAERGVNFTNAHTAGVFCAPSRAAIFSGQYASTTGCYRTATYFFDHPEIESLQTSFTKSGYATYGAGKLFHHSAGMIDQRNWTEFYLRSETQRRTGWPMDSWSRGTPFPEPFPYSPFNKGQEITGGLFLEWAPIPNDREAELADTIRTEWVIDQLSQDHKEPFFLALGLYTPHFPNYCPQKYFDLYRERDIELPPYLDGDLDDLPEKIRKMKTARSRIHQKLESIGAVQQAVHGYLACISYADAMIGRVLDALEASDYADNTIVVFWSDHGYHHGEKGDWGKHTLWERTSNVPFIWAGPKICQGMEIDSTVSLIDIYPTLVELCGLEQPRQTLEGESLAMTLQDTSQAKDRNVLLPHMNPGEYAVINKDWRYIRYGEDGEELYRVSDDPNEWENLAGRPELEGVKRELQRVAPVEFAPAGTALNARRDLRLEGDAFEWKPGEGNYVPSPKYLPYTNRNLPDGKPEEASNRTEQKMLKNIAMRRNVLFVICDDLNTHVSTSGYGQAITPSFDRLAAQGMTFDRAYCQYPVCGPSRASLLSGLYPEVNGVLDNEANLLELHPDLVTMPEFFKQAGYWTGSTGKVFHNARLDPGERAWSEVTRFENDELPVLAAARKAFEAENGAITSGSNRRRWREISKEIAAPLNAQTPPGFGISGLLDEQHKDGKNANQVIKWLTKKPFGKKPFFISLGLQKPHVPFLAPEQYFDLHPRSGIRFSADPTDLWDFLPSSAISKRYEAFGFELGVEQTMRRQRYMQAYHACVSFIDRQLGRVLDTLETEGYWDETVIVFTSDHGYHLGDHFLWGKVTLFDIGTRVPLIIRVPEMTAENTHSQAMVELIDLYPTLADISGLTIPSHLQGRSLRPLLGYPDRLGQKRSAYTVVRRGSKLGYAIRDQRWRYTQWPDGEELYHLPNDPTEKNNLIRKPHVQQRLEEYRESLAKKRISVGAK